MARVTLQTIADQVGVSRMTVSNAFSRPDQLSAELRERILAAADALGYVGPDPSARALATGTTGAVGVLLTESLTYAFTDEVATGFLGAIADELAPTGLALTLLHSGVDDDVVPARDVAVDGAVVYSCLPQSGAVDWLLRRQLPLVFVDQDPLPDVPSVNIDDRAGARAAAEHLVALGHRRVGIVTLVLEGADAHPQRERMLGWHDVLDAAGIEPTVVKVPGKADLGAEAAAAELLGADPRPTAVLCFSDVLAAGVVRVAHDLGLDVPADLSVVGFDDSPVARRSVPALTTVHQDVGAKGRVAAAALAEAMAGSAASGAAPHHLLPVELVVRASTGPAPR